MPPTSQPTNYDNAKTAITALIATIQSDYDNDLNIHNNNLANINRQIAAAVANNQSFDSLITEMNNENFQYNSLKAGYRSQIDDLSRYWGDKYGAFSSQYE